MTAMTRRLRKLESRTLDATGFAPHSEAWFEFYEEQFSRWVPGEQISVPLAVIDRMLEEADRDKQMGSD